MPAEIAPLEHWISGGALPAADGCTVDDTPVGTPQGEPSVGVVHSTGGAASMSNAGSGASADVPSRGWPMFGGDLANTRNNAAETKLSVANVAQLKFRWANRGIVSLLAGLLLLAVTGLIAVARG